MRRSASQAARSLPILKFLKWFLVQWDVLKSAGKRKCGLLVLKLKEKPCMIKSCQKFEPFLGFRRFCRVFMISTSLAPVHHLFLLTRKRDGKSFVRLSSNIMISVQIFWVIPTMPLYLTTSVKKIPGYWIVPPTFFSYVPLRGWSQLGHTTTCCLLKQMLGYANCYCTSWWWTCKKTPYFCFYRPVALHVRDHQAKMLEWYPAYLLEARPFLREKNGELQHVACQINMEDMEVYTSRMGYNFETLRWYLWCLELTRCVNKTAE